MNHHACARPQTHRYLCLAASLGIALAALLLLCASAASAAPPSQFGTEGTGAGQFIEPRGIAVEQQNGNVYLVDRNNQRVEKFGPEGEVHLAWGWGVADGISATAQTCTTTCFAGLEGSGSGQFDFPEGIAVDNDPSSSAFSDVYVADSRNLRVEQFDENGNFILMFGGEVNETADLTPGATEAEKNLCTAISGDVCTAGTAGVGEGQFGQSPRSIAVDAEGTVYVGDLNRVQKFTPGGAFQGQITLPGTGELTSVAVDPSKNVYVTGTELAGAHKYDGTGAELGEPRDAAGEPTALAVGAAANLFVNEGRNPSSHHILEYEADGEQGASFDAHAEGGFRGIAYGEERNLLYVVNEGTVRIVSPPPPGPLVLANSEAASSIEPTSATISALINPEGAATEFHFEFGTTATYGTNLPSPDANLAVSFEDQPVSVPLSGLAPGTVYHYRLVATNSNGTARGPDQTFETLPPVSIDATSASAVSSTGATLEAELNPNGLLGEYHFEYGPSGAYGTTTPVPAGSIGSGNGDITRTAVIQGLEPGTIYHYRVVAHNALGTVVGPDRSFTTQNALASLLPDGRAWELVSPPNKHGAPLESISEEGGVIQASAKGTGITYLALGPIVADPAGNRTRSYSQDISDRSASGWSTEDITTPHETVAILAVGFTGEYRAFSEELDSGAVEPQGATPLSAATTERTPYSREADGSYTPLVTASNVVEGVEFGGVENPEVLGSFQGGVEFIGATPDLRHIVLASQQALTGGFTSSARSLYEWTAGQLQLISVLPGGQPAAATGVPTSLGNNEVNTRSAISNDGKRVIFETNAAPRHLYLRDMASGQTALVDIAGEGLSTGLFKPEFQGASADGDRIFFTDEARLTQDSSARSSRPDLYMCEVKVTGGSLSCAVTDLTVDPTPGSSADVQGLVLGVDEAGNHVFFVANGVLTTTADSRGEVAAHGNCSGITEGRCNLYMYDAATEKTTLVAVLSGADGPDWNSATRHELGNMTARVSGNGRYLAFMSSRSLTGYDNRDRVSAARDQEVFRYDSVENTLSCVSCNPTGARPLGVFDKDVFPGILVDRPRSWGGQTIAGSIPGWTLLSVTKATYQSRYLSNSGRMFFNAADALVPGDSNGFEDVYEFESPQGAGQPGSNNCTTASTTYSTVSGGCINLISSGTADEETAFLDASESGDDVFFLTAARLAGADTDAAADVYDAHVCSVELPCPPPPAASPPACAGDACQLPASPPAHPTPGTLLQDGPGNVLQCPKGKVKQKGKCVKKKRNKNKHKKSNKKKNNSNKKKGKNKRAANTKGRTGR